MPDDVTGYSHASYAESLSEFGAPRLLPRSGGWLLQRRIPGSGFQDAMGCYPIFSCLDWTQLPADLEDLSVNLVSVALVTDPFGEYDLGYLKTCFPDVVVPFKSHFVVDLSLPPDAFVSSHHRRNVRKALREMTIEECTEPSLYLAEWCSLYARLISRHQIRGLTVFSRESFAKQLSVPGIVALRAVRGNESLGISLWYEANDVAYYHLGAYSERGYELRASFAMFHYALRHFAARGLGWLNLGGAAGISGSERGLSRFKEGWATGSRIAYFCGRIYNRAQYEQVCITKRTTDYFPAYRQGEFA
ncbi:MAG: GNAT family N-acetyltransferase [Acidobacteriota bacterium]|nr:GNAT family N-acetyltransferase [Acidobacteriota bacterium]